MLTCEVHRSTRARRLWWRGLASLWAVPERMDVCAVCEADIRARLPSTVSLYLDERCTQVALALEARPVDGAPAAPAPKVGGDPTRESRASAAPAVEASPALPAAPVEQPPGPAVGSPAGGHLPSEPPMKKKKTCTVPGCSGVFLARGRCSRHHERARRGGWMDLDPVDDDRRHIEHQAAQAAARAARTSAPSAPIVGPAEATGGDEPAGGPVGGDLQSDPSTAADGPRSGLPPVRDGLPDCASVAEGGEVCGAQAWEEGGQMPTPRPAPVLPWAVVEATPAVGWEADEVVAVIWAETDSRVAEVVAQRMDPVAPGYQRAVLPLTDHLLGLYMHQQVMRHLSRRVGRLRGDQRHEASDRVAAAQVVAAIRAQPVLTAMMSDPLAELFHLLEQVSLGCLPMPTVDLMQQVQQVLR